jgi:hypothetical protein
MRIEEHIRDIDVHSNVDIILRQNGKRVGSRSGHNVFTITGRNLLSKLLAWSTLGSNDLPFTNRRVRWVGVGTGSQLEVTNVEALVEPAYITAGSYLASIDSVSFPDSTTVRFIKEFSTSNINIGVGGAPITLTEAGLFADVSPALYNLADHRDGLEDTAKPGGSTLDPSIGTNPPIAYKAFEGITKTTDFTLEIHWDFLF